MVGELLHVPGKRLLQRRSHHQPATSLRCSHRDRDKLQTLAGYVLHAGSSPGSIGPFEQAWILEGAWHLIVLQSVSQYRAVETDEHYCVGNCALHFQGGSNGACLLRCNCFLNRWIRRQEPGRLDET